MKRLLILGTVCGLTLVSSAAAAINIQHGIGGAALGNTRPTVKANLGPPTSITHGTNDFGAWTQFAYPRIKVTFQGNAGATSVSTASPIPRTAAGIGVGSTVAAVKAKVPGIKCLTEVGSFHCYVGTWDPGRRVTDFSFASGHVSRVTVGFVID